jgi:predicted nucleotidyltransferase component of viral defense system
MNDTALRALARDQGIDVPTLLHERREVKFLAGIGNDPVLATHLAFKGGTALRFVYLCDRYSDDFDFDCVRKEHRPGNILERLQTIAQAQELDITDAHRKRNTILLEVRERGWKRKLKIEVSILPRGGVIPTIVRNIVTPVYPASVNVLTYPLPVLLSGKMLAVLERATPTPRDLYDLFWLLSRNVEEDGTYLRAASRGKKYDDRKLLYRALLSATDQYSDRRTATELGAMLPKEQRAWVRSSLKARTTELLTLRLAAMG